jgi:hypothetical protein
MSKILFHLKNWFQLEAKTNFHSSFSKNLTSIVIIWLKLNYHRYCMRPINKYDGHCGQSLCQSDRRECQVNFLIKYSHLKSVSLPSALQFHCKNFMGYMARVAAGCNVNTHRFVIKFSTHEFIKAWSKWWLRWFFLIIVFVSSIVLFNGETLFLFKKCSVCYLCLSLLDDSYKSGNMSYVDHRNRLRQSYVWLWMWFILKGGGMLWVILRVV